ncbi:MAG: hypothetical protein K0Q73_5132 [Paenibacillus sp.]|nr:hypothetical protein [Paenibacillus sp.]
MEKLIEKDGFSSGKLKPHWEKHGNDFGDITQNEYLKHAKGFAVETNTAFKEQAVGNFQAKRSVRFRDGRLNEVV